MNFFRRSKKNNEAQNRNAHYPTFLELLNCNEEFVFTYNNVKYEIVQCDENGNVPGISLYFSDDSCGTFIQAFTDNEEFLNNAKIEGKPILQILNDIKI